MKSLCSKMLATLFAAAALIALPSCGSDEVVQSLETPDASQQAQRGYGLRVVSYQRLVRSGLLDTPLPLAGARAFARLPDGSSRELQSDEQGWLDFGELRFDSGRLTLTVEAEGYVISTVVGLGAQDAERELILEPSGRRASVTVSGQLRDLPEPRGLVIVASTGHGSSFYGPSFGETYVLEVPKGQPFALVGAQARRQRDLLGERDGGWDVSAWAVHEQTTGLSEDLPLDLDFSSGPLTTRSWGVVELPETLATDLREGAFVDVDVSSLDSLGQASLGAMRRSTLDSEGRSFAYELDHLVLPQVRAPLTTYRLTLFGIAPAPTTTVRRRGYPESGARISAFVDPPRLTLPDEPFATHPLSNVLTFTNTNSQGAVLPTVYGAAGAAWRIELPARSSQLDAAALPAGPRTAQVRGDTGLSLDVRVCRDRDRGFCLREAHSGIVRLN
jgi:hypothetical protein